MVLEYVHVYSVLVPLVRFSTTLEYNYNILINKQGSLRLEGGRGYLGRGRERWVPADRVVAPWYFPGPRSTPLTGIAAIPVGVTTFAFSLFPYPYRLLVCRKVKPEPTTVTHTWLAINAQDTFCRITATGLPKQTCF